MGSISQSPNAPTEPSPAPSGRRGATDRVPRSHAQTRVTLRCALAFFAAAAIAAACGGSRWLVLHLLLAGGAVTTISAVSLMLAVTWASAPAPPDGWVTAQRIAVVAGAAGVAVARGATMPHAVLAVAGSVYLGALVLLAALLAVTIRRGVERRFDVAVASHIAAVVAGVVGASIGIWMGTGTVTASRRAAHATVQLLGLVGLVVAGTMPFFASTVGRSKMARHARPVSLARLMAWMVASAAAAVIGLLAESTTTAVVGLVTYAVGIGGVMWYLPRPTRRQLQWAGPRLVALWCGALWWAGAVVATAADVGSGQRLAWGDRWVVVLAVGGFAQILWGSLAYLLPMLRGGGPQSLSDGFATTRSWPGLVAVNAAAAVVAAGLPHWLMVVLVAAWVADSAWRAARVGTRKAARPAQQPAQ